MPASQITALTEFDCFNAARRLFEDCYRAVETTRETAWVAHVDRQARFIHLSRLAGDESSVSVPLEAIVNDAVEQGSAGILFAHNHPGGTPWPTMVDVRLTRDLASAAEAVSCVLLDHLLFTGTFWISFRRTGLL